MKELRLGRPAATAAGLTIEVEVGAASRLFLGHFPGLPVLPGVALLMLIERAWEASTGRRAALSAVLRARFRTAVSPGDRLRLELRGPADRLTFRYSRGGDRIAEGIVALREVDPA